ncbi:XRE family transcriptional regulator [Streptomyces caniscabiei]|uniref:nSTAND1 domain-containing NTPase n=1 Tax=Streptomyces caniscabiei TaxID=2746961 RepID=UPI001F3AA0B1|nr:XRE family transcriptional regulator [Streptomyces sp. AMCC400023]UJV38846.1 XRE family transcriptional regulator [Streptomyces sp. AMCC400023]
MPRRERPLDGGDGPLVEFAAGLRQLRRKAGNPPYRELADQAHYSISTLSSAASGQRLPTLAVTLAYVRACAGDTEEWRERWREAAELLGEGEPGPGAEAGPAPPYAGLRSFRERDSAWFFGRERLLEELAGRLERQRFVVVIGASGSGKSSLLRAGLVPRLRETAGTTVVVLTPGARPLEECAIRLGALAGLPPGALYGELRQDPANLGRVVRQITSRPTPGGDGWDGRDGQGGRAYGDGGDGGRRELVLVVDQFEESFTLCQDTAERSRFVEALVSAASDSGGRCRVALGTRADFYAHCTHHAPLVEAMRDAQVPVGPMSLDELRRAVLRPARRAGLSVEGALLATLVAQAHGQAGVLPLLSHALLQTWRRRRGNALTLEAFETAGGLEGALARTAEEFYQELDPGRRRLARQVFVRLTALGDGTEDTRRPARLQELQGLAAPSGEGGGEEPDDSPGPAPGHDEIRAVLDLAAGARLLTLDRDRVELAHEALIRCWPRLHGWLTEDREATRGARRLTEAAQTWEALGREPGALYRGTRLALAAGLDRTAMSASERAFLDAGLAAQAAERAAERRRTRLRRLGVGVLGVLLVLTTTTAALAVRAQRTADEQRDVVGSQRAADRAAALRTVDPALAAQLSLAAYRLAPTPEARGGVLSTFATPYATRLTGPPGAVTAVAFSADGRVLVTGDSERTVRLRRVPDAHHPGAPVTLGRLGGPVRTLAVRSDGRLLAAGGEDGTVALWNIGDPRRPRLTARLRAGAGPVVGVAFGPDGHTLVTAARDGMRVWRLSDGRRPHGLAPLKTGSDVTAVAFHRDGRTVATGQGDGTVRLWELAGSGERLRRLSAATGRDGHSGQVNTVAFSPDGRRLATGGADFTVRLWDMSRSHRLGGPRRLTAHTDAVDVVAFSPDGRRLVSGGTDGTVRRWELTGSGAPSEAEVLTGHTGGVRSLAFRPDGRTLASGSEDQSTRLWDLPGPALTGHTSSLYSVAFSPDGRLLATGSYDRTVRLWNLADRRRPHELPPLTGHTGPVNTVAFSPDGSTLASGSADGTLRLWALGPAQRPRAARTVPGRIGHVNTLAFSPDGRTLATGGEQGTVRLWNTADVSRPRPLAALPAGGAVDSVAFAPDGRTLAVADRNREAVLWDVTRPLRPARLSALTGHTGAVKSVAFAPDGRTLATGSEDRTVRLWDLADPRSPVARDRLTGYTDGVMSVAFAPDGRTLAAASADKKVRLYGLSAGGDVREPVLLSAHAKPVDTLAFSPDGRTLATGSEDWTALLWDPDVEHVAARICDTAFPAVTRAEWRQYFPHWAYRPPCGG